MSAQKGKDLLLKVDAGNTGTFVTVAGLRSRRIEMAAAAVDVTHQDSPSRWRELLEGAGTRTATITGGGIFKDDASDETVRGLFFDGAIRPWQVIIPAFGRIEGLFQITALDYSGDHDGEVTFTMSLQSAGQISFTGI